MDELLFLCFGLVERISEIHSIGSLLSLGFFFSRLGCRIGNGRCIFITGKRNGEPKERILKSPVIHYVKSEEPTRGYQMIENRMERRTKDKAPDTSK